MRRRPFMAAAVLALVLAGCGEDNGASSDSSTTTPTTTPTVALAAGTIARFGQVLTANGRTLYFFANDQGVKPKSTCNDGCAVTWPPLLAAAPADVASDLNRSLLGETTRDDGATQYTWNGMPLYLYSGDSPGQANGQGIGGVWHVAGLDGKPVVSAATTTTARGGTTTTKPRTTATTAHTNQTSPPATSPPATSPPTTSPPVTSPPTTIYYYP